MRHIASRILLTAGLLFGLAQNAHATVDGVNTDSTVGYLPIGAGGSVAMTVYPPAGGNDVTFSGNVGIFTPAFPANALVVVGEAEVTSLTIGGSGVLTKSNADTLLNLQNAACGTNQALSANVLTSTGAAACVNIIDPSAVGTYSFPSCPGGALAWSGSAFTCISVNAAIANLTCVAGQAFTSFSSGVPVCGQVVPDTSCSTGDVVTGFSGGSPTCAAFPSTLVGTYTFKVPDHIDFSYAGKGTTQECPYARTVTVTNGIITNVSAPFADTGSANYLSGYAPCTG